ncbi:MAG: SDR family oxidoreductase [Streptococcaceae bacterium]|jgi:NAD(P)-dependent dehydrogenase (short-subunit alcohol dehydrogenase family)|nr:SDR family oxidoreductase [Streptococcaceae bacterium]
MSFKNKCIIVTGGANGIGKKIVERFLEEEAIVYVIDQVETLDNKAVHFFSGDLAQKETLENFVKSLDKPIDVLVNNAALSKKGLLSDCSYEDFEYVQKVNVIAPYYLTSLLKKNNLLAPNASIINMTSTRAFQSQADTESYSASKGGIAALTHSLAISLSGIARVNSIAPGWIDVSDNPIHSNQDKLQHPVGRVGSPDDIAQMVLFLASEKSSFITGENVTIDGGMSKLMIYNEDNNWHYNV